MKTRWAYCRQCKSVCPICPNCGNNMCTAGSGEIDGKDCKTCLEVYNAWDELRRLDLVPNSKGLPRTGSCIGPDIFVSNWLFWGKIKVKVANFFFDIFHSPERYMAKKMEEIKEYKRKEILEKMWLK